MITRISIAKVSKAGAHFWLLYRWERTPSTKKDERLTYTVLAEDVAETREQATDDALAAADRHAHDAPLEDWLSATRPIAGHDPEKRHRRWAAAFMSEGATALSRKAEIMESEGKVGRAFTQEETAYLYTENMGSAWTRWSVIGSTSKRVHALEMSPGGLLRPDGLIAALEPTALKTKGHAGFQGLRFYTEAGRAELNWRRKRHAAWLEKMKAEHPPSTEPRQDGCSV